MVACASPSFPYEWFTFDYANHKLLAKTESGDQDIAACAANTFEKTPCAVIKMDELKKLIADYEKLQVDLDACQKGSPPTQ